MLFLTHAVNVVSYIQLRSEWRLLGTITRLFPFVIINSDLETANITKHQQDVVVRVSIRQCIFTCFL